MNTSTTNMQSEMCSHHDLQNVSNKLNCQPPKKVLTMASKALPSSYLSYSGVTTEMLKDIKTEIVSYSAGKFKFHPGLSEENIVKFEKDVGVKRFPEVYRRWLAIANGSDSAPNGELYSYPRDINKIITKMRLVTASNKEEYAENLQDIIDDDIDLPKIIQGYKNRIEADKTYQDIAIEDCKLHPDAVLVPFFAHRFVVCVEGSLNPPIVSVYNDDAIVYGKTFDGYLLGEFAPNLYNIDIMSEDNTDVAWRRDECRHCTNL